MRDNSHIFQLISPFSPKGDQGKAIDELVDGLKKNKKWQVLQGATGTGKTFTMANIIAKVNRPALVIVHNKTLAAQLYGEFKELFPNNRVEYFISNFDFYRPEAYMPKTDTYIDKEVVMNEEIEMLRSSAVNSLLERRDTIVVCSVAAIYGLGDPSEYSNLVFSIRENEEIDIKELSKKLIAAQYTRNNYDLNPGSFRIRGNVIEVYPPSSEDYYLRIYLDMDKVDQICQIRNEDNEVIHTMKLCTIYPAHEYASTSERIKRGCETIKEELKERILFFDNNNKPLESERIKVRTEHDIDALLEFGICSGIENYTRHFDGRKEGETPYTLFDYLDNDFITFIDESHSTIPQINGMYNGDRSRKETLVEYGFRLPSALDNRPLRFEEFLSKQKNIICTSATPGEYELEQTNNKVVEQIIRPTGLLDPIIEVRSNKNNPIQDLIKEIDERIKSNERVFVITLTIKDAENLTNFLKNKGYKVAYLQHEILTLQRSEIIYKLRKGIYDVLVGINLLREGLDIPETSLIAILDADREGFLRSKRSLVQIIGRAARNINGKVIMYSDNISSAMEEAIKETKRRRDIQDKFNKENNIIPKSVSKPIYEPVKVVDNFENKKTSGKLTRSEKEKQIKLLSSKMKQAAKDLDFEQAAYLRDQLLELKASE